MGIATRANGTAPPEVPLADIDLGTWDFWALDDDLRDGAFTTLRREAPISFWPEPVQEGFHHGAGHWALTGLDDVFYASRHPEIFSSSPSITITTNAGGIRVLRLDDRARRPAAPAAALDRQQGLHPEGGGPHRGVGARAGPPAGRVDDRQSPDGQGEAVSELAGPLPLQVICDMMGIPEQDHQQIFHWTNVILGFGDPDLATEFDEFARVSMEIGAYADALAEDRRVNHHDDLTTSLVEAEVDGERLTSAEVASFFILLAVAGNETTRNAISHGLLALTRYPEQRQKWWADFDAVSHSAVEEIVRWASPVIYMRRTLTHDFELNGTKMAAGDKATLWYCSANRDESKFPDPWMFDVTRDPNPHVGFGGGGAHFCLGANLARREIRVMFEELHREIPDVVATEEPARLLSPFIHGIKTLPIAWTPPG